MKQIPLRAAVVAGTCAVALSFVAVPAWASTAGPGTTSRTVTVASSHDGETEDESADDSTTGVDDDAEDETENESDDLADDSSAGASLPAEQGTPTLRLERATLSPAEFAKRGVTAVATGLTPGVRYQPFWSSGSMGDTVKGPKKADRKGTLTFTWKPRKAVADRTAVWTIGIGGVETEMENVTRTLEVKYDSDLTWEGSVRHGRTVTLTVSLDRAGRSGEDRAWKKVPVAFQKQVDGAWVTVKTKRTNGDGVAKATVRTDATTVWRAVVDGSATVAGSKTKGHRG